MKESIQRERERERETQRESSTEGKSGALCIAGEYRNELKSIKAYNSY